MAIMEDLAIAETLLVFATAHLRLELQPGPLCIDFFCIVPHQNNFLYTVRSNDTPKNGGWRPSIGNIIFDICESFNFSCYP